MSSANQPSKCSGIQPKAYAWDFDGACVPLAGRGYSSQESFSVGVFQWLPKSSGRGLKRGKVMRRIHGHVSDPQAVYDIAHVEVAQREKLLAERSGQ